MKIVSDRGCDRKHRDYQILPDWCFDLIIENDDLDETVEKIKEIVVDQLGVNDEDVKLETNFVEDLDADSLDLFQVIMEIEDAFNVKVEDVENIKTVADAVSFIESATAAK